MLLAVASEVPLLVSLLFSDEVVVVWLDLVVLSDDVVALVCSEFVELVDVTVEFFSSVP